MSESIAAADFDFVSTLVRTESAIVLEAGKEYLVESRLNPVAEEEGFTSLAALVTELRRLGSEKLRRRVVEALTTNETSFFRDLEPFQLLKAAILPDLIEKRKTRQKLTIWSAACSSGQEPYSLAMLLRETFPAIASWQVTILATDLNREIVERAKAGAYTQFEVNRGLPVAYLVKYFEKNGTSWVIKPELKKNLRFECFNLLKSCAGFPEVDLILLRNVLIYFDVEVKRGILERVRKILSPDGYLLLGASETTIGIDQNFERHVVGKGVCYRRVSG